MKIQVERGTHILSVILILLSIFLFYETFSFPKELGSTGSSFGSAFFPRLLLIFIIACSLILFLQSVIGRNKTESDSTAMIQLTWDQIARVLGVWLVCVGFYLAWREWGYLYTSSIFLLGIALVVGIRNIIVVIALMAAGPLMYVIFAYLLKVSF